LKQEVAVWDIWVRLFHWTLVGLIGFSWLSSELGGNWMIWHTQAGFITAGLIVFRIVWGVAGSWSARFSNFVKPPRQVIAYVKGADKKEHLSHNPLGALSVVAILLLIALQVMTGLFANDDIFIEGPFAHLVSYERSLDITEVHETLFNLLIAVLALHIAAVLFHQVIRKEPLIQSMLHGRKPSPNKVTAKKPTTAALIIALASGASVSLWLFSLS